MDATENVSPTLVDIGMCQVAISSLLPGSSDAPDTRKNVNHFDDEFAERGPNHLDAKYRHWLPVPVIGCII